MFTINENLREAKTRLEILFENKFGFDFSVKIKAAKDQIAHIKMTATILMKT